MNKNEIKLDQAKYFGSQGYTLMLERDKTTIFLVQLIAALLAVATFSEKIIEPSLIPYVKILIAILLFATPIMIWDYIIKISDGINSALDAGGVNNKRSQWSLASLIGGTVYIYITIASMMVDLIGGIILNIVGSWLIFICLGQISWVTFIIKFRNKK